MNTPTQDFIMNATPTKQDFIIGASYLLASKPLTLIKLLADGLHLHAQAAQAAEDEKAMDHVEAAIGDILAAVFRVVIHSAAMTTKTDKGDSQ